MRSDVFEFTVDTHLFRELGELLVGRDSTALIELIKNAYDADATQVVVSGNNLYSGAGNISIMDNGVGMTPDVFRSAFLRIAGRYKDQGNRRSSKFGRRYTGAKGLGRLSAHKLAERLHLRSVPQRADQPREGVQAAIDWRSMERDHETLNDIGDGLSVTVFPVEGSEPSGTELLLEGLRAHWTSSVVKNFVRQIAGCQPSSELLNPPKFRMSAQTQLGTILPWTRRDDDPGFEIKLLGDLDAGDDLWGELVNKAGWLIEINASAEQVEFLIHPSADEVRKNSHARPYTARRAHPDPVNGPFFVARIYYIQGSWGSRTAQIHTGIRVFLEGFRVAPYGERHDDWLGLDQDYARRIREFQSLGDVEASMLEETYRETFRTAPNLQYIGGVFLTAEGARSLRPVVNREGFLQDASFEIFRMLVRNGVDLLTRARAATAAREGEPVDEEADTSASGPTETASGRAIAPSRSPKRAKPQARGPAAVSNSIAKVKKELSAIRAAAGEDSDLKDQFDEADAAIASAERFVEQAIEDQAMLQVLASVGLQFSAFIHEVNGLLGQAQSIRDLAGAIRPEPMSQTQRVFLRELIAATDTLCQSLARQAGYLTEVVGPDARRRRRRIPLAEAPLASLQLLGASLQDRNINVDLKFDESVRTPPIFPAELTIIYTNLLTNAIKAAGIDGRIQLRGAQAVNGDVVLVVENTGDRVDLEDAEKWFTPFESTTIEVDVVLGQGMGLGLPITRRVVDEYGGQVHFVPPSPGFSTAVEVVLPPREVRR